MTTTDIETEIEVAKKSETKKSTAVKKRTGLQDQKEVQTQQQQATQVNIEELNEIALAHQKQSHSYNATKFEEERSEYADIQQNNTTLTSVKEINQHETNNKVAYLPQKQNKNSYNLKNARVKNFIICASIVLALSVGLIVYNSVQITLTNMQIANIETQISTGVANYESALKQLKKLTSAQEMQDQALDLNMGESTEAIKAELIETRTEINAQTKTNWFNKLCNFLSNIFRS